MVTHKNTQITSKEANLPIFHAKAQMYEIELLNWYLINFLEVTIPYFLLNYSPVLYSQTIARSFLLFLF